MFHHFHRFASRCEDRRFARGYGRHDEEGHGPFGRHHHRGGRGGRFFEQGELRLVILHLVSEQPRHGYELIKAVEELLGGAYSPSPGVVYPTLTMLEEMGQITPAEAAAGKKPYAITDEGRRVLAAQQPQVQAMFARMAAAGGEDAGAGVMQLRRALHNLRVALRMRLMRGRLSQEQLHRIVSAIDALAQQVERE